MATSDKPTVVDGQRDLFDSEEKQWLKVAITNQIKSLERMMAKYPVGSGAHAAHGADVEKLRRIMAKV